MANAKGNLSNGGCDLYPSGEWIDWVGLNGEVEVEPMPGVRAYKVWVRVREFSNYDLHHTAEGTLTVKVNGTQIFSGHSGSLTLSSYNGPHYSNYTEWFSAEFPANSKPANFKVNATLDLYEVHGSNTGQPGGPDYVSRPGQHFRYLYGSGSVDISGLPDPHTHIAAKNATINKTSGKSIIVDIPKVSGASRYGAYYDVAHNSHWWDGNTLTYNFTQGTTHKFKSGVLCSCGSWFYGDWVSATTWSISSSFKKSTTKSMTFTASHKAGTGGNASSTQIVCNLYKSNDLNTLIASKNISNGADVVFSGLTPNTSYKCIFYSNGIKNSNGEHDNTCSSTGTTGKVFEFMEKSYDVSATTIKVSAGWKINDSTGIKCKVSCNNGATTVISNSSESIGFTKLNKGTVYQIQIKLTDDEGNTHSEYLNAKTKQCHIENTFSSTKNVKIIPSCNYPDDLLKLFINNDNTSAIKSKECHMGDEVIFTNLTHNKIWIAKLIIVNCYAYNEFGEITEFNDSTETINIETKKLGIRSTEIDDRQHMIITKWQITVDDKDVDKDSISGSYFDFVIDECLAVPIPELEYQNLEVDPSLDNNIHIWGYYIRNNYEYKYITFGSLKYYYCKYKLTAVATDGYNKISSTIYSHTTFPFTWIYDEKSKEYKKCIPHVYTNNKWVPAPVFINSNGNYKESNGENS